MITYLQTFLAGEQRTDQSRGDVPGGVKVGVVDPGQAVGIVICGGKFWSDLPVVSVAPPRRNRVVLLQLV